MKTIDLARKAALPAYRILSLITLYAVLLLIVGYAMTLAFYISSGAWAVPFVAHDSDTRVLTLTAQIANGQQTLSTLQVNLMKAKETLRFSLRQLADLTRLRNQLDATISNQKQVWTASGNSLTQNSVQKQLNNQTLSKDAERSRELRQIIEHDLTAGLITKGDAQQQINALDQFVNSTTDSKVSETLLTDSIRQHYMTDVNFATVLAQKAQLEVQIAQLFTDVKTAEKEVSMDEDAVTAMQSTVETAKQNPYYQAATKGTMLMAILPYNDKNPVKVGNPVYDCYIGIVFCGTAGKVVGVYMNEEMFEHPILHMNMRGYIIKLDVDQNAAKSSTLFMRKPLLF